MTSRGNERKSIFRDERDRNAFVERLERMVEGYNVRIHAYVLMDNHYHLLLETPDANLSLAMQWLNLSYTVYFNRRHRRSGHLFQGRFKSVVVDPVGWGLSLTRYIHLNPVRVGRLALGRADRSAIKQGLMKRASPELVRERVAALNRHGWSSYPSYVGRIQAPKWLTLEYVQKLGNLGKPWGRGYRQYVEQSIRDGVVENPFESVVEGFILGTEEFAKKVGKSVQIDLLEQRKGKRLRPRPALDQVIKAAERVRGENWEETKNRHGDWTRDVVFHIARRRCGLKLREVAKAVLGHEDYSIVAMGVRNVEKRVLTNGKLRAFIEKVEQYL